MGKKHVYQFGGGGAEGDTTMRDVLGGKGAGLAEMSRLGIPVPLSSDRPLLFRRLPLLQRRPDPNF